MGEFSSKLPDAELCLLSTDFVGDFKATLLLVTTFGEDAVRDELADDVGLVERL